MALRRLACCMGVAPTTPNANSQLRQQMPPWMKLLQPLQQARSVSSLLSYEEVSAGSPTPEHPTAPPSRTLLVLHGLLGCGRNWRTWARRLVEAAAARYPAEGGPWRAMLVDLRCHGASTRRPGLHPPNNMESAAADVSRLVRHLMGSHAPGAVLGHSMGGKVALALLQQTAAHAAASAQHHHQHQHHPSRVPAESAAARAIAAAAPPLGHGEAGWCSPPRQLWVLDSQPGLVTTEQDAGTGISRVLNTVHSVPLPIPSRAWLLRHLKEQRGLSDALANWLASNLVQLPAPPAAPPHQGGHPVGPQGQATGPHRDHHHHPQQGQQQQQQQRHHPHQGHTAPGSSPAAAAAAAAGGAGGPLTWAFDIQCAGAMYMSYRTTEFWQVLENPPNGTYVHLVQGARSDRWPEAMQRRLTQAAAAAAASTGTSGGSEGTFDHHVLEGAGHWLHVDNPEGLLRLVLPRLAGL